MSTLAKVAPVGGRFGRALKALNLSSEAWVAGALLALWLLLAILGPAIAPHDPTHNDLSRRLQPPVFLGGTWDLPLGADLFGRDLVSRVIAGARPSALVAFVSVALSGMIGTFLGMVAGYTKNRLLDGLIMRLADLTLAFPTILLALLLAVQRGPSLGNVITVLTLLLWARFAKLARGEVLSVRTRDYVSLAVIAGAGPMWVISRHLLPNIFSSIMVLATVQLAWAVLAEATLSFLGAGVPPPEPAWGSMVSSGLDSISTAWWVSGVPGAAIVLAILSLNLFGDWLRDRLDPRLRQI
jgi:peptide/nickel transport system permease protein